MKSDQCVVFATPVYSAWEISDALSQLRVSHSILVKKTTPPLVRNLSRPQPKWVHVSASVYDLRRGSVNFITASYAELSLTNYPRFPESMDLDAGLRHMLQNPVLTAPSVTKMRPIDYVNQVSKPSLLNNIQTQVYKIQPYSLRKETQAMILDFFGSKISKKTMVYALRRSFKTAGLIPLMEQGLALRDAVARLKSESVEAVAQDTGIPTFDLLYLSKVRKPAEEDKQSKKKKE